MPNANIVLNWSANPASNFVSLYEVERSLNGGAFEFVTTTPNLTHTMNNQTPGVYRFRIRAYNFVGVGPFSAEASGPTDVPGAPSTPTVTVILL